MNADQFRTEGWHCVEMHDLPEPNEIVEFGREESVYVQPQWFGKWSDFRSEFNVAGLWWRKL